VIELTVLAIVGLGLLLLALFIVAVVIRVAFWLLLLPFRLIFGLLLLPFLLIKAILGGLWFVLVGPLFAFVAIVTAIVLAAALAVPLAPVLLLLFACWMIARSRKPTPAIGAGPEPPRLLTS
jgi:hypothetical protein